MGLNCGEWKNKRQALMQEVNSSMKEFVADQAKNILIVVPSALSSSNDTNSLNWPLSKTVKEKASFQVGKQLRHDYFLLNIEKVLDQKRAYKLVRGAGSKPQPRKSLEAYAAHHNKLIAIHPVRPSGYSGYHVNIDEFPLSEIGRASGQSNRDSFQRRSIAKNPAQRRFFHPSAQAHPQGQTGRTGIQKGQERPYPLEKKAVRVPAGRGPKDDAEEALVFQDEMEIHLHPTLTRMWGPVGQQPQIPSGGKNEKRVVYGGVDYKSGKIIYTVAQTKSGQNFLAFLIALATAYAGRKVRLVCDNGRFHQTKAVQKWLKAHRDQIRVFWLPPYCPSLNMIERLWGHIKRTVLANVLFATMDDLVAAFRRGVACVNGHRNKMGFMFDHDDVREKAA